MIPLAHIHPMLVHFPIVLLLLAFGLDFLVVVRGKDLAARAGLAQVAFWALLLGTVSALVAAAFGDMAAEIAMGKGLPESMFEGHESLAQATIAVFGLAALFRIWAVWKHRSLAGGRGWGMLAVSLVGVCLLIATAYHGGQLVFDHGVAVASN